jgi:hypothetical protein
MTISTITLKNAARAIECDLWTDSDGANYLAKDGAILRRWEPEHDDGDALRLAVKLGMRIYIYPGAGDDCTVVANDELRASETHIQEAHGYDPYLATRKAIVRAAAALGESLCQ